MMMRFMVVTGVILVIAISLWAASQQHSLGGQLPSSRSPQPPPGVLAEMWIPLTDTSGVALNVLGPPQGTKLPERGRLAYGTLMIKSHGVWEKVYLEPVPEISEYKFVPVH